MSFSEYSMYDQITPASHAPEFKYHLLYESGDRPPYDYEKIIEPLLCKMFYQKGGWSHKPNSGFGITWLSRQNCPSPGSRTVDFKNREDAMRFRLEYDMADTANINDYYMDFKDANVQHYDIISDDGCIPYVITKGRDGGADALVQWCIDNVDNDWFWGYEYSQEVDFVLNGTKLSPLNNNLYMVFYFEKAEDAAPFKLIHG